MKRYRDERLNNAIAYFSREYKKKARKPLSQTTLYKFLAFVDFQSLEETGEPVFELSYKAMERGPVPMELYGDRGILDNEYFKFQRIPNSNQIIVVPKKNPNFDYFSQYEVDLMKKWEYILASPQVNTHHASEGSHEQIRAWRETFHKIGKNEMIKYINHFENIQDNKKEKTPAEEHFLIYSAIHNVQ